MSIKPTESVRPTLQHIAEAYDRRFAAGGFRESESFYRWVLRRLAPLPGKHVLDVSCGEGHLLRRASLVKGAKLFGVDISTVALDMARGSAPNARYVRADGIALPYLGDSFDYVTNLGSLEHYSDPAQGVAEIARLLKPKGKAAILLPNSYYLGDIVWWVWRTGYGPPHKQILDRFATCGEWRDLIEAGGLEIVRVYPYNLRPPLTVADVRWYAKRPTRLLSLLFSILARGNLAYGFLFVARKPA